MHTGMWEHPATQSNLVTLPRLGATVSSARSRGRWPPATRALGRMADPEDDRRGVSCGGRRVERDRDSTDARSS